jgi:hypothetical protein
MRDAFMMESMAPSHLGATNVVAAQYNRRLVGTFGPLFATSKGDPTR